ncbi:MAG: hypothetical protein JWO98_2822 [Frankiales bacterium]|nr:hypothetical protein [Frankiales bacterium]
MPTSRRREPPSTAGPTVDTAAVPGPPPERGTAPAVRSDERQEVSAARVNRQQAAAAADVRARQEAAAAESRVTGGSATESIRRTTAPLAQALTVPIAVGRKVGEDITRTARRPDAVLFWAGLAGLAALGALDWPAAAAIGVGIAVAGGARRARS